MGSAPSIIKGYSVFTIKFMMIDTERNFEKRVLYYYASERREEW